MTSTSPSVANTNRASRYFAHKIDKNPVPAPNSSMLFPCIKFRPLGEKRNVPRHNAASQVLRPVVPADARTERASSSVSCGQGKDDKGAV